MRFDKKKEPGHNLPPEMSSNLKYQIKTNVEYFHFPHNKSWSCKHWSWFFLQWMFLKWIFGSRFQFSAVLNFLIGKWFRGHSIGTFLKKKMISQNNFHTSKKKYFALKNTCANSWELVLAFLPDMPVLPS